MTKKEDVKIKELGAWGRYANVTADVALPQIYEHAEKTSQDARDWYWKSIKSKRMSSLLVRSLSFFLLVCGAVMPILAGLLSEAPTRLQFTQFGVAALAVAGLLQAADRVFGWSSGWLRYMTTATAMETATRKFELDWANYMINKAGGVSEDDKRPLYELAKGFENDISKLQTDETEKWYVEFNSSLALLSDLIKSQRESAEKTVEAARSAVTAQETAAATREKAQQPGAIELSIVHKAEPVPVKVRVDDGDEETFSGAVWSKLSVSPGLHTVAVTTVATPVHTVQKVAQVPAGGIGRVEVRLS